jgi:hypothetical protein
MSRERKDEERPCLHCMIVERHGGQAAGSFGDARDPLNNTDAVKLGSLPFFTFEPRHRSAAPRLGVVERIRHHNSRRVSGLSR